MIFKQLAHRLFSDWYMSLTRYREKAFLSMLPTKASVLLGVGCYDGDFTYRAATQVDADRILGYDYQDFRRPEYKDKIELKVGDLSAGLDLPDSMVDVAISDQVIEHLQEPDIFMKELYRVLRPGGTALVCTENLSAWHNLMALFLGFQAFAQQMSSEFSIGNPLSPHYKARTAESYPRHVRIFTPQGLKEMATIHGFQVNRTKTIGYWPLWLSPLLERLDPIHGYFLGIRITKPTDEAKPHDD